MNRRYDNLLLIYYSGTGNSKRVCEWIGEKAVEEGVTVRIASFHQFTPELVEGLSGKTLIGFFSATHGFNMPHSMLKFMARFDLFKGSDIFIGNTRAGMKLSKIFLPGLSGIALYFPAMIMWFKGYKVRSIYPVDLPSNWISLHPGLKQKVVDSMFDHYRSLTRNFTEKLLNGKRIYLKGFILLPLDILVAPIALGYYFCGRYIIAKTFYANEKCDNCGLCIQQCPTQSIVLKDNRPFWKLSCESCMKCMNYCPKRAIETAHSFFFILLIFLVYILSPLLVDNAMKVVNQLFGTIPIATDLLRMILQWSLAVVAFVVGYRIIHYLSRYRFFNRLLTYTSFTYWRFWRRYKAPRKSMV